MFRSGEYTPLSETEAIDITKEMYKILMAAGINIMRVGLKSTDLMTNDADLGHGYHPAFRQLVEGAICLEQMKNIISKYITGISGNFTNAADANRIIFRSNAKWFSPMIGHKGCNKKYFRDNYPGINFIYETDPALNDGKIEMSF